MVGVERHNDYATIYCHVSNSRLEIFLLQFLHKTFSSTSPRPNIQPYLSTTWTGRTHLTNSQAHHATTTHPLKIQPPQATKLGVLSLPLLPSPRSIKCSHGSPCYSHRGSPPPTDPQTGISRESHPSSTVCPQTPAPSFPHPQFLPICKGQLTSPTHNLIISPIVCIGHFRGRKTE